MIIKGHKVGYGKPLICVSVTGTNKKDIEERFHKLSKIRIDAVEWRADFFDGFCDKKRVDEILDLAKKILKNKIFIYTIRTSDEGGAVSVDEESYNTSIMIAASHKTVDIIDCQINSISKPASLFKDIKAKGKAVLASFHDFEKTPPNDEITDICKRMKVAGADILKCALMPKDTSDVFRVESLCSKLHENDPETPLIFISMGEIGMSTRLFAQSFGSCLSFAYAPSGKHTGEKSGQMSAPGQVHFQALNGTLTAVNRALCGNKPIFITGFMGTGKTTISRALSKATRTAWKDLDKCIEEEEGMAVSEIFEKKGEEYFRELESKILKELSLQGKRVLISCGGGTPMRKINADIMKKNGVVLLLDATPETVFERVRNSDTRPLLNGNMNVEFIRELMDKRRPFYEDAATHIIVTDGKSINDIVKILKKEYF